MTDRPSLLDPLLVEGPRLPMETLRPAVSAQRVLLLDTAEPRMADLATGDIRRWENGPPVSVPCVSNEVDLRLFSRLQFQVLRDPRPTSIDLVLLAVAIAGEPVDVVETVNGQLQIKTNGQVLVSGPIGGSPAIVVAIEPGLVGDEVTLRMSVRNAESPAGIDVQHVASSPVCTFTIGGPSTALTGVRGRRRLIPVHVEVQARVEPVDMVRAIGRRGRRALGMIRERIRP